MKNIPRSASLAYLRLTSKLKQSLKWNFKRQNLCSYGEPKDVDLILINK